MNNESRPLTTSDLAKLLGKKDQTIRVWRSRGKGPRYIRLGGRTGRVIYFEEDVKEWLAARTYTGTSEEIENYRTKAEE